MKILLTGADGFTGRHFQVEAERAGHEIVALRADLTDPASLEAELAGSTVDAVVHLAAISFVGHADENAFYAVNVLGTTRLLDVLARLPKPPRRILLASSANVYGNCERSPIAETQSPSPVNHYAMSKLAMEYMASTYLDRLHLLFARPFNYTGAGQDRSFVIPKLAEHFARRAPSVALGNLDVEREFNDVRSVCAAYLLLLEHGKVGEVYNVCSGRPHSLREVIAAFKRITGHDLDVVVDPAFVRPNELHRLCGDPGKLEALGASIGMPWKVFELDLTLQGVLDACAAKEPNGS